MKVELKLKETIHAETIDGMAIELREQQTKLSETQQRVNEQEGRFKVSLAEFKAEFMLDMQRMFALKSQPLHALPSPADETHPSVNSSEATNPAVGDV